MDHNDNPLHSPASAGLVMASIHSFNEETPLRVCVLVRAEPDLTIGPFVLLRELPGSRVYLGAV